MSKKSHDKAAEVKEPTTVEEARQQHFDREKAAYEKRTGEKVNYQLDEPLTNTPLVKEQPAEAEGEG